MKRSGRSYDAERRASGPSAMYPTLAKKTGVLATPGGAMTPRDKGDLSACGICTKMGAYRAVASRGHTGYQEYVRKHMWMSEERRRLRQQRGQRCAF